MGAIPIKVICITGKAGSGKDTAAQAMKKLLGWYKKHVLIIHYADLLKFICRQFFDWNGEKDRYGRNLLQFVGTDVVRAQNPDYWVDFVVGLIKMFRDHWDYVLIPDCRFPNERQRLIEEGFDTTLVRIVRGGYQSELSEEQQAHPSETAMDGVEADVTIYNVGSLDDLNVSVAEFVAELEKSDRHFSEIHPEAQDGCESCKL